MPERHPEWANNRPSILDRFKLHSTLVTSKKSCDKTRQKIAKRELQLERLNKVLKEGQDNLVQLRKDDILMRQDLSTYEARVEEHFDISGMCEDLAKTV